MPPKPHLVKQLFEQEKILKSLLSQTKEQQKILSLVKSCLPDNLSDHCNNTVLNKPILYIYTDSPVWVSKLRFEAPNLLTKLRSQGINIASIYVKCILTSNFYRNTIKNPQPIHSDKASELVKSLANTTLDTNLRNALIRLAKSLRNN